MNIFTEAVSADSEYTQLLSALAEQRGATRVLPVSLCGLCDGAADMLSVSLLLNEKLTNGNNTPAFYICSEEKECIRLRELVSKFGLRAAYFCGRDLNLYNISASHEYEHERLSVLFGLLHGNYDVIFSTPDAVLLYTIEPEALNSNSIKIDFDTLIEPLKISEQLVSAGYSRAELVEGKGQFAVRGGIIDIYPAFADVEYADKDNPQEYYDAPVRIELFGDEIDRMGQFHPDTQRIFTNIKSIVIPPAREVLANSTIREKIKVAVAEQIKRSNDERAIAELISEAAAIDALDGYDGNAEIKFIDKYLPLVYSGKVCLLDYFKLVFKNERCLVLYRGTAAVKERFDAFEWHENTQIKDLLESGTISPKYTEYSKPQSDFEQFCDDNYTIHIDSMASGLSGKKLFGLFSFRTKTPVSYFENLLLLCEDLNDYIRSGYRTVVLTQNETESKNLLELLESKGFNAIYETSYGDYTIENLPVGVVYIKQNDYMLPFELVTPKIVFLSTLQSSSQRELRRNAVVRSAKKKKSAQRILSYAELSVGDYVVHETYGIGQYMGIENMSVCGVRRDYINIRYAGSDKLFLPVERLDSISKYIGAHADDGMVKLSKFGGGEWAKAKSRAKASAGEMAKELIALYAERMRREGFVFPPDDDFQRDFEANFEYVETDAQLVATEEIKADMERNVPMDRLLCGDVGYGKTEVAFRAAYKAVLGGKQVAILVPTTILAMQHYQTISSRMRNFAVNIDMLSRFRTPREQAQTLRRLERGEVDVIIGTHRLVSKDVKFHDLGLLVVDEEQRFGVAQKEKLKATAVNIDVLTLSATPIPRTLNMAMSGIRDISVLDEAPSDRLPVQTYVLEEDDIITNEAIKKELRRGGQVFYLHNNIEDIDSVRRRIASALPDARISVAHGRMDKDILENIWRGMLEGETDILISTSIIETGIDVPNANTLIVDNSHRLGLSQLHQLRGRVGRSSRRAYAYFTYPRNRSLSEIATKRLEAIREYAEFGAGFKIALRDLELRGVGNLLGTKQHGHLDAVGYDLYIKLLNDAVLEEKGESVSEKHECTLTLDVNAFIPESYVKFSTHRISLYKKISLIRNIEDKLDVEDELLDRYGDIPKPTQNLLMIALIRAVAEECDMKTVTQQGNMVKISPYHIDIEVWGTLADEYTGRLGITMANEPYINFKIKNNEDILSTVNKLFDKYLEIMRKNV